MTKFFKEEVPVMVGDLREAASRMAHICKAGRPEWVECRGNCPGRMACGKEQLAPAEIPEAAAEEVPG
ncbi:MAG: hypothetical protein HY743_09445, partial [Deltaproteobacteria bacterium]|nr:hypothetical protein [Deltaproteobacteria bacterium]